MGCAFSCPTLIVLTELASFLVSANEAVGSSGAGSPAAASVKASRREMLDAGNCMEDTSASEVTLMANGMAFCLYGQRCRPVGKVGRKKVCHDVLLTGLPSGRSSNPPLIVTFLSTRWLLSVPKRAGPYDDRCFGCIGDIAN